MIKKQVSDKTLKLDADIDDDEIELSIKPQLVDETEISLESLIRPKPFLVPNLDYTETSEMSLTSATDNSKLASNQTVLLNHDANSSSKISQTVNLTNDMSLTQVIESDYPNNSTLKIELEDEMAKFLPTSSSTGLPEMENKTNMQLVVFNPESQSNKENISNASNISTLKSAMAKSVKRQDDENKEKKSLRFSSDTKDPKEGLLKKLKDQQKKYPVLFISSKSSK